MKAKAKATWRDATLVDLVHFQRGFDITKAQQKPGDVPVVSSSGISSYHDEAKVDRPGIVIGRKGTLGTVHYVDRPHWPHDTTLWVTDFKGNDPTYAYYFLLGMEFEQFDVGAANPTLNRNHIHGLPVRIAPLPTQRRIASILSAYDDLIENNTRRMEILEEMARSLYREWFVYFRFPGHEKVKLVDSELGKIPDGWEVTAVEDRIEIVGGGTPSKAEPAYWDGGTVNWYSPTDLTGAGRMFLSRSASRITNLGLSKSSARLFPAGCVMMTSRATLGVLAINTEPASTNQGFITCIPNERMPRFYLFFWLRENEDRLEALGTGATFKEITKGVFRKFMTLEPPTDVLSEFESTVLPFCDQIRVLEEKNAVLRQTRDLLLPKLISGAIDVDSLDLAEPS